jgi:8-oxo-dGTP diphosphatase
MTDTRKNPDRPHVGVGAVVFKDAKILLVKRGKAPKKGEWSLPGGSQKLGETLQQAVLREIKEETGLNVKIGVLLDAVDFIEHQQGKVAFHYTLIDYVADYGGGTLKAASDADDARFFSLAEALSLPLWTETKRIIKMAAALRGLE